MTVGLILTTLGLGLRHGLDWDHIAAIADLSSTAESRRRGFFLSFVYAAGHGVVVILLGAAAIMFGAALPEGVDVWMGRVVGATLIALGAWVLIELFRKGRDFRLRSRWILVIGGTFAGLRRVRQANAKRQLSIEHEHEHEHEHESEHDDGGGHKTHAADQQDPQTHDHDHLGEPSIELDRSHSHSPGRRHSHRTQTYSRTRPHSHTHSHTHETVLTETAGTGNGTAAGIGILHGIGFESPTQIAVFVASTSVVGVWAGFALLATWVLGLVIANSALAALAAYGLLGAERNFVIYATVAVFVGVASLIMGVLLIAGIDALPTLV